jgi:hypothetical protein
VGPAAPSHGLDRAAQKELICLLVLRAHVGRASVTCSRLARVPRERVCAVGELPQQVIECGPLGRLQRIQQRALVIERERRDFAIDDGARRRDVQHGTATIVGRDGAADAAGLQ